MDSILQREMFAELVIQLRQSFDLPESKLKWVKARKNLQLACYLSKPYRWEQELIDKGIEFRSAWSLIQFINDKHSEYGAKFCADKMNVPVDALFICTDEFREKDDHIQHRFIAPLYKASVCNLRDSEKEKEAVLARTLATAISQRLGRGPKQLQAFNVSPSLKVFYWSGLLSIVEKECMQYSAMRQETNELERCYKEILVESIRQVNVDFHGPKSRVVFSEKLYDDQGIILLFKDGL